MGFFRDFEDDMMPEENPDVSQDQLKEIMNTETEEDEKMSDFEDANVDKDLLSQIFAEDADDEQSDDVLKDDLFADSSTEEKDEFLQEEIPDLVLPEMEEDVKEEIESILEKVQEEPEEEIILPELVQEEKKEAPALKKGDVVSDVTIITKGTTINGGISSDGSLEIMGTITGDVECLGKLSVYGQISGDISAANVLIDTKRLEGSIVSDGMVEIVDGTILIGDIMGTSAIIAGAVKGNIEVNGPVKIDSTAIVKGSIKAQSIQMNNGAVVDGYCSLNHTGDDLNDFFEEK